MDAALRLCRSGALHASVCGAVASLSGVGRIAVASFVLDNQFGGVAYHCILWHYAAGFGAYCWAVVWFGCLCPQSVHNS